MVKRSAFAISKDKPRRVYQVLAVDEFGELAERKMTASGLARQLGHQMGAWHRRRNDALGRWDSWCVDCNRIATVATETDDYTKDHIHGRAVRESCERVTI